MEVRSLIHPVIAAALVLTPAVVNACDVDYGREVADAEAIKYVGFARDQNGKPIPQANVYITQGVGEVLVADAKGNFRHTLGIANDPDEIQFVCNKEGYASSMGVRSRSKSDPRVVFITCNMHLRPK